MSSNLILYAATNNRGKLAEFQRAAQNLPLRVLSIPGLETLPPCEESGATFEQNARLKAEHYSRLVEGLVFADDSGLEVAALDGAPGVRSARYVGPRAGDAANNRKLLEALAGVPPEQRAARFVCVLALARQGKVLETFEGAAQGLVLEARRGSGGFGYDPLFLFPALGLSFAELSPEQKLAHSHRGAAFRKMAAWLLKSPAPDP